jgi:hypothetical protein
MAHGTSKGVVDGKFKARIKELELKARKAADHFKQHDTYREWHMPDSIQDVLDVPNLHEPDWNRDNINRIYSEEILKGPGKKGGTVGDLIAMKWQADFMTEEERAFRTRHASFVRCAALMHGKLDGHGIEGKSIFSFLKDGVQTHIDIGAKSK